MRALKREAKLQEKYQMNVEGSFLDLGQYTVIRDRILGKVAHWCDPVGILLRSYN